MTSSGTYTFDLSGGNLVLNSLAKAGVGRAEITTEMLSNAEIEANLLNIELTNRNPHQFLVETVTQALSADTAIYSVAARIASVACAYLTNDSDDTCRVLHQLAAAQYAKINDKTVNGIPNSFWINQAQTPTIYVWPLVDADDTVTYTLNILSFVQPEDFEIDSGTTTSLPYRFLDAFSMGLAHRMALIYRPDRAPLLGPLYEKKLREVTALDQEDVPLSIVPNRSAYRC